MKSQVKEVKLIVSITTPVKQKKVIGDIVRPTDGRHDSGFYVTNRESSTADP